MKLAEFKNSKWYQEASQPGAQNLIGKNLSGWLRRVRNLGLASKANELWGYITGSSATGADKVLVLAALAYLISPLDLVPDAIPVVGWLDDIGLATFVLQFLNRKITRVEPNLATDDEQTVIDLENIPQPIMSESAGAKADQALIDRLDQIRRNAMDLEAEDLMQATNDLEAEAQAPLAQILFAGRYNTGKSTLLNTLLGGDWLPTGPVPTTKGIIYIMNGARPALVSQDQDSVTTIHNDPADLLDKTNPVINMARSIVLTIPSPLLGVGVALVDSPGLEDPQLEFSRLTLELAPTAAMVVIVLDASTTMSRPETEFLEGLLASDRNRKLLIVVNKIDRLTASELKVVTSAVRKQLQELDCNAPLFMLSAEKAKRGASTVEDTSGYQEYLRFRAQLEKSLTMSLRDERRHYFENRVSSLDNGLRSLCEARVEMANLDEAERQKVATQNQESNDEARKKAETSLQHMEKTLDMLYNRTLANHRVFFDGLESVVAAKIQSMGLDQLKETDEIAELVRKDTKRFTEEQLEMVHSEFGKHASSAIYELQTGLQGLSFRLKSQKSGSAPPAYLIPPAILVLAFPILGFFSFIYLAAGMMLGRKVVENLYSGLMASVGLNRVKAELITQLQPKLWEFEQGVFAEIDKHFETLRQLVRQRVQSVLAESQSAVLEAVNPTVDFKRLDLCREILDQS